VKNEKLAAGPGSSIWAAVVELTRQNVTWQEATGTAFVLARTTIFDRRGTTGKHIGWPIATPNGRTWT